MIFHIIQKIFNGWKCENYTWTWSGWKCPVCGHTNSKMTYKTKKLMHSKDYVISITSGIVGCIYPLVSDKTVIQICSNPLTKYISFLQADRSWSMIGFFRTISTGGFKFYTIYNIELDRLIIKPALKNY